MGEFSLTNSEINMGIYNLKGYNTSLDFVNISACLFSHANQPLRGHSCHIFSCAFLLTCAF